MPAGRGNTVAIALSGLAVAIAMTGTAVAVTATQVNISDPVVSSHKARVDGSGRLQTVGPANGITISNLLGATSGDNMITSPTKATLAITTMDFSNPSINASATSAEVRVYVYKVNVDTSGTCTVTSYDRLLAIYNVGPGDDIVNNFAAPLLVKPTGTSSYCLDFYASTLGGTYSASYLPAYTFAAYVASGSYSGTGVAPASAPVPARRKVLTGDR